ncbi:MAG: methyltransferase domain-containing protein [Alphaproteobacteria bacterium]|nr:methyltransferase domain-containing protein [Alphaproteobacteria bacterium]
MAGTFKKLEACRLGGSPNLLPVLSLGRQSLTGVFPATAAEQVTEGPLELVWCPDSGLLQLAHSYEASEMYGDNYGYRSGLNASMVAHLKRKFVNLESFAGLSAGDTVVDIGSNDGTGLKGYETAGLRRIGIDPTGEKFRKYYDAGIELIPDFFSAARVAATGARPAKIVTSIAMFYDVESPVGFAREVERILDKDGIWHFEQSYMPSMLRMCSYDTICHEHLEYYSLAVVTKILDAAGLRVIDVEQNAVNGGSFAVTAARKGSRWKANDLIVDWMLEQEERMGLGTPRPYRDFEERVYRHRSDLVRLVSRLAEAGKKIVGYGASTKGNVILQFCGLGPRHIAAIAEVNETKFGRVTPGTHIPIVSEADAKAMNPDFILLLPWHFKDGILRHEEAYRQRGGKFIVPFPEIEIL